MNSAERLARIRALVIEHNTLRAQRDALMAAGKAALEALTADTIGTINMDDPDWYAKVDDAAAGLRKAIAAVKQEGE